MKKNYREMSHEELVAYVVEFGKFLNEDAPTLLNAKSFGDAERAKFRVGTEILSAFPQCASFYKIASRSLGNANLAYTLVAQLKLMSKYIVNLAPTQTINGEKVVIEVAAQALRRGKPTAAESEQREKERKAADIAKAVAEATGAKIAKTEPAPIAERESDTSRRKSAKTEEESDLFTSAVNAEIGKEETTAEEPTVKSLKEYMFMYPEPIAMKVKGLKDLLSALAMHSEKAKMLVENGGNEAEIQEHTSAAKELNEQKADLYNEIDKFLATAYVMLHDVNKDFGKWAEKYAKSGGLEVLLNNLKYYYDKTVNAGENPPADIHAALLAIAERWEETRIKAETRDPEKEKRMHAIKAYLSRKDVKDTPQRLAKLKEYFEEAKQLEMDADFLAGFEVIISNLEKTLAEEQ